MDTKFIEIIEKPTKLSYEEGELFDISGALIEAEYEDGTRYNITDLVTYSTNPLTRKDTHVVLSFMGEVEGEEQEFTVSIPIMVFAASAWKFLDGAGLQYFYALLLTKFMSKSSTIDSDTNPHLNKVMVFDDNGNVSYVDVTIDDISYIKDISSLLPDSVSNKNFSSLLDFINVQNGYLKDTNLADDSVIENILNDNFGE